MAIYHLRVSNVSRAAGSSAVAAASYITSRRMRDERTGVTSYGYGRRERVEHTATLLPKGAPEEWRDPARLFNAVEMAEKRGDARPAKKIVVALPREFDAATRIRAVEDFTALNLAAKGYAATYAIHTDRDGNNPHAHILVANRRIDPKTGRWAAKRRTGYALDTNGARIPVIDPKTGRQKIGARGRRMWKRAEMSNNPLDSKDFLQSLRADWAETCNLLLPQGVTIDHRSLNAQGIDREPTVHEGYAAREIEKRGGTSVLMARNRAIRAGNARYAKLKADLMRMRDEMREALERLMRRLAGAPRGRATAPEPPAEIFAGLDGQKQTRRATPEKPAPAPAKKPAPPEKPVKAPQKPERTKTGTGTPEAFEKRLRDRLKANLAASQKKQAAGRLARPRHHGR